MKPNIILVTVDCWRGDTLGAFNSDHDNAPLTPNIDELVNNHHYFTNAYSCGGWTKIAMTSLFSSTPSSMYGFSRGKLSSERALLAQQFKDAGYITAGFTTNPVCGAAQGFNQGFDEFEDLRPGPDGKPKKLWQRIKASARLAETTIFHQLASFFGIDTRPYYPTATADELVDKAVSWLSADRDKPVFLWLHFMDLHWPYRSSMRDIDSMELSQMWRDRSVISRVKRAKGQYYPGDKRKARWEQLYREEVHYLDKQLGRLIASLQAKRDWENTALCLTSDHGEEFFEHGTWGHSWNQLHTEGVHSPLIFKLPKNSNTTRYSGTISHLDIAPTLLDIANIEPNAKMQGQSLLGLCDRSDTKLHTPSPVVSEMHGHAGSYIYRLAITWKEHRYIYDGDTDNCFLFDLQQDPNARKNIYARNSELSREFDSLRLRWVARGAIKCFTDGAVLGGDGLDIVLDNDDPAIIERLRALGYME